MKSLLRFGLLLLALPMQAAEPSTPAEPGPEDGGLRLRLTVAPRHDAGKEGFDVRVELLNVTHQAIRLQAAWENDDHGGFAEYVDAATSIECVPAVQPWMGQIAMRTRGAPQPEHTLKPGETLSVRWQTAKRCLKNRVMNPLSVQNPEFPFPGLYAVNARLEVTANGRQVHLRSNEQLVSVGGSRAMPKSSYGRLIDVEKDGGSATLDLGSRHKIEPGDQFEYHTMRGSGRLTITKVNPEFSTGTLEVLQPAKGPPPPRGMEVSIKLNK